MFWNNFKIAVRNLRRNKVYFAFNVMGLALSVGSCILIFLLVKYHLGFDIFHSDKERIYRVVTEQHRDNISYVASVPPAFGSAFRTDHNFADAVSKVVWADEMVLSSTDNERVKKFREDRIAFIEPEFLKIFNFPMIRGNAATILTEPNAIILTEKIARKYFGDADPVNKILRLEGQLDLKVAGIMKDLPSNTDFEGDIFISWPTLTLYDSFLAGNDSWSGIASALECYVRLRKGVSPAQVEKVFPAYVKKYRPGSNNVHHYKLQPLSDVHFDARYGGTMEKRNIWILAFTGLFLLVTACVNFVNLSTAQAIRRSREVGVRKVLGSRRVQLFWQFIAETGFITLLATVLAIGLAKIALPSVNQLFDSAITLELSGNLQLIVFVPVLMLLVTFLAGAYPGILLSGFKPAIAIKSKVTSQNLGGFNVRRALIVTQFAISLLLIISMIVINRQMRYATQSDLGFDRESVVMIPLGADTVGSREETIQKRFAAVPGVEKVSMCYTSPSSHMTRFSSIRFENRTEEEAFRVSLRSGDDQYLPTFKLKLLAGRNILPSDTVKEYVINEALMRKLQIATPQEAIGKMMSYDFGISAPIVGVVRDFHDRSFHEDINPIAMTSNKTQYSGYAIKFDSRKLSTALPAVEKIWSSAYPEKIYEHKFIDSDIAEFYETEEKMFNIITAFSIIAIFIGCIGLYGLVTFMVAQKTKEIGIRKVLGSGIGEIIWIFGKEFAILIAIAFVIAAPIAWWMMSAWLQDFKYQIPLGPGIFIASIAVTVTIALLTVAYQSIHAALMNPVKSLRSE